MSRHHHSSRIPGGYHDCPAAEWTEALPHILCFRRVSLTGHGQVTMLRWWSLIRAVQTAVG
jgi:hypothetical protein